MAVAGVGLRFAWIDPEEGVSRLSVSAERLLPESQNLLGHCRMQYGFLAVMVSTSQVVWETHIHAWHALHASMFVTFRVIFMVDVISDGRVRDISSCVGE